MIVGIEPASILFAFFFRGNRYFFVHNDLPCITLNLDLDLDLVKYFTGTLSFEWVINVKGGIYNVTSILIVVS